MNDDTMTLPRSLQLGGSTLQLARLQPQDAPALAAFAAALGCASSAAAQDNDTIVVLGSVPGTLLVTTTVTVQEPFAGMVSPVNASAVWLVVKVLPAAPTHVPPAAPAATPLAGDVETTVVVW